ncbi:brassinosteroid insensitive 1-associated receptor kinase 1, partial [Phtheirospermum japonicum]
GKALLAFTSKLTYPHNFSGNWNQSSPDPCTWDHVTCNQDNNVIRVLLNNNNLSGDVPQSLAKIIHNISIVMLYGNNISGMIPNEFGVNLTNLISLDLYDNRLTGNIPGTLGKLSQLKYLCVYNDLFSSQPRNFDTCFIFIIIKL